MRLDVLSHRTLHIMSFHVMCHVMLCLHDFCWLAIPGWYDSLIVHTLEWSGPVFIKLGQWASTRPDLFDDEICVALERLQV